MTRFWLTIVSTLILAGCQYQHPDAHDEVLDAQEAAYQQCLQENMAVATAWEAIEQSCRERMNQPALLMPRETPTK